MKDGGIKMKVKKLLNTLREKEKTMLAYEDIISSLIVCLEYYANPTNWDAATTDSSPIISNKLITDKNGWEVAKEELDKY